ncbi:MAG: toprim domain-containing protein, partial [bacterium]|nr:toprim domain-containing protein [bacterium]
IYPPDVLYSLVESDSMAARYVLVEAMLAGANKFLEGRDKPRQLIRQEIKALSIPHFGKPRIDGIVLQNGKPLGDDAFHWLKDGQFVSAGDLINQFRHRHGYGERWVVERKTRINNSTALLGVDLFAGQKGARQASTELVTDTDRSQLEDYLSMIPADTYYVGRDGSPWEAPSHGRIEVLTADSVPHIETVILSPERQQEIFRDWSDLTRNRVVRNTTDARGRITYLVACTKAAVKGKELIHRNLTYEYDVDPLEVILGRPIYLNPELQIGERVGKNKRTGEPYYMFNYESIVAAIEGGELKARNFSRSRKNFHMKCVSPLHVTRRNHTMHVNLANGLVKCFSCGVGGFLDSNTVPEHFAQQIRTVREINRETQNTQEVVMSEEHLAFMEDLQKAFQKYFNGSRGEKYLRDRGLDPDEAFKFGAGYGDSRVTKDLMDGPNKWTIEQMVKYGLLGIREKEVLVRFKGQEQGKVPEDAGVIDVPAGKMDILSVLVEAGLAKDDDEAVKLIGNRAIEINGKTIEGNCTLIGSNCTLKCKSRYFKWNGRVTFPLVWGGRITSFYGRATWKFSSDEAKNKGAHRKAKIARELIEIAGKKRWTNSPQGAFNGEILQRKDLKYLVVTEGVADALSLMAMGIENVVAIIGTYNDVSIEELAASGIPVYVALDADIPGSMNAYKVYDKLKDAGLKEPVYNLTPRMFSSFAEHTRVRPKGGKEPRLVSEDDLILYRALRHLYLRKIEEIEDSGFPKDYNEMLQYDRSTSVEMTRQLFTGFGPEHQITPEMYSRIFEDSSVAHDVLVKHGYSEHIVANGSGVLYQSARE